MGTILAWTIQIMAAFALLSAPAEERNLVATSAENQKDTTLQEWCKQALLHIAPPEKYDGAAGESVEERRVRYEELAEALAEAITEGGSLFSEEDGGELRTAALLITTGFYESGGFRRDVGDGSVRGDRGRSWCYMQINLGTRPVYFGEGEMRTWYGEDLVESPRRCFLVALEAARYSMGRCSHLRGGDVLSVYTTGKCMRERNARVRWDRAQRMWKEVGGVDAGADNDLLSVLQ